jgi:glycosyltransferase involved in cell wall biosynthesis
MIEKGCRETAFGVVAIGRNEGERLKRCLHSVSKASRIVYVDSGSTDDSVQFARGLGIEVVELDMTRPFSAARARNAGIDHLRRTLPDLAFVQLIDGDCELISSWPDKAISVLIANPRVAAVCGHLRERNPNTSIYNWLCDIEWQGETGTIDAFGGIVMIRAKALAEAGGFRDDLIAGEEPELAVRLRSSGWLLYRLDTEMALHDATMTNFLQWWRRSMRAGYAFAHGTHIHGKTPLRHYVWETQRALLWGIYLPLACLGLSLMFFPWGMFAWLVYPTQFIRQAKRNSGSLRDRATLALFQLLARFPEGLGVVKFRYHQLLKRPSHIIEYK